MTSLRWSAGQQTEEKSASSDEDEQNLREVKARDNNVRNRRNRFGSFRG